MEYNIYNIFAFYSLNNSKYVCNRPMRLISSVSSISANKAISLLERKIKKEYPNYTQASLQTEKTKFKSNKEGIINSTIVK